MHFFHRTITVVSFCFLTMSAAAQVGEAPDPLFQDNETLQVMITAPLTTLVRERPTEDYLPGTFQFTEADGSEVKLDLEIRTRGNFRHETCDYPPLRLNFKKSQTAGTLFDEQDKLKLVIHCDRSERYEQTVLREYLAYRILNVLTDMSFRVRLLRVNYVNNENNGDGQVRYGFLIEHKSRLARRFGMKEFEIERTTPSAIQPDRLNLTSVFEFLIGNTDFSPVAGPAGDECCHNYVLFRKGDAPVIAIPYDFDQSGLVDAPYATPNERFRIRNVRQRLYRGRCINNGYLEDSLRQVRDRRDLIYALIEDQEGLQPRVRKQLVKYIDDYYDIVDDPDKVRKKIIDRCI